MHEERLPHEQSRLGANGVMGGDERLGYGGRLFVVERVRDPRHGPFVNENPVSEPSAADESEHTVSHRPGGDAFAARVHPSRDLEAGDIGRASRWCGIAPSPLLQVGRVEAGEPNVDDDLLGTRDRIWPVLDKNDIVPTCTNEHDCSHLLRSSSASAAIPSASSR